MHDANPGLLVVFKSCNETIQLRVLGLQRQTTATKSIMIGITCIAKPNPPKKYEATNKGNGGAGAWMTHETSWQACPSAGWFSSNSPKSEFLTKYDQLPESEIRMGEVNIHHRARNETLDP